MTAAKPTPELYRIEDLAVIAGVPPRHAAGIATRAGLEPDQPGRVGRGNAARYSSAKARALVVAWRLERLGAPAALVPLVADYVAGVTGTDPGPRVHPSTIMLVIPYELGDDKVRPLLVPQRNLGAMIAQHRGVFVVDLHLGGIS